jgi:alpha,alpha-trehalase
MYLTPFPRPPRQWDDPFGWAPHQMLAWQGLRRYGLDEDAERLAYRWLHMLALNARGYNGAIAEKYDVVRRTLNANVEYGNVGVHFEYVPDGGFGWTNASFQTGLGYLSPHRRHSLNRMVPPEWLFGPPGRENPCCEKGAEVRKPSIMAGEPGMEASEAQGAGANPPAPRSPG